jgi:hypothetical protein
MRKDHVQYVCTHNGGGNFQLAEGPSLRVTVWEDYSSLPMVILTRYRAADDLHVTTKVWLSPSSLTEYVAKEEGRRYSSDLRGVALNNGTDVLRILAEEGE